MLRNTLGDVDYAFRMMASRAIIACLLPAWRATRVDPVMALQTE